MQSEKELKEVLIKAENRVEACPTLRLHLDAKVCGVLQCVAVCCSVLQCVAVCCSVLQCVAVCWSKWQCVGV